MKRRLRLVIHNAQEFLRIRKQYGSFLKYVESFNGENAKLLAELQDRFRHVGESSSRIYLLTVGVKVPPSSKK